MLACKYAEKYKATKYPNCNNGKPCVICLLKWEIKELKIRTDPHPY
jgi:hypothetical protein